MKFKNAQDISLFLLDVGRSDLIGSISESESYQAPTELVELFLQKRTGLLKGLKNFRKSQDAKGMWRKHRADIMRGIKSFHRSTEGKRFHRNLGRFIASRTFTGFLTGKVLGESLSIYEKSEIIKAISSVKTHLFIEMEYYHPVYEQLGLEIIVFDHLDEINDIEMKIIKDEILTEENCSLLINLTEEASLIKSFAEKTGKTEAEIEQIWDKIKNSLKSQGKDEDDKNFYAILVGAVKNALNLDN